MRDYQSTRDARVLAMAEVLGFFRVWVDHAPIVQIARVYPGLGQSRAGNLFTDLVGGGRPVIGDRLNEGVRDDAASTA